MYVCVCVCPFDLNKASAIINQQTLKNIYFGSAFLLKQPTPESPSIFKSRTQMVQWIWGVNLPTICCKNPVQLSIQQDHAVQCTLAKAFPPIGRNHVRGEGWPFFSTCQFLASESTECRQQPPIIMCPIDRRSFTFPDRNQFGIHVEAAFFPAFHRVSHRNSKNLQPYSPVPPNWTYHHILIFSLHIRTLHPIMFQLPTLSVVLSIYYPLYI